MDKQDELAELLARTQLPDVPWDTMAEPMRESYRGLAAAVRSFMMSDEVVGDAAQAIYECGPWTVRWRDLPMEDTSLIGCVHDARAALSAAIGEDGGGRGTQD